MAMTADRAAFYDRMAPKNLKPLWEVLHGLTTPEPKSPVEAAIWHYDEVRPFIMESGRLITAREAERRVLVLENPGLPGQSRITSSLYAGLQLILPGEIAPAHRHSQAALRFIVEGAGAYTAVDGERTIMREGDFVITPSWTWHDHGNASDKPMVWLDGLDIPIVTLFDASFLEKHNAETYPESRPAGDALARYGSGLMPLGYDAPANRTSPVFNYPYARTREALEAMRRTQEWDACHGLKLRYVNPVNGDYAMPTIGTFMQLLPKGFAAAPYRATDATVFSPVEGKGTIRIGEQRFDFAPRDVFIVPSWQRYVIEAAEDAVLFSFSDRPVQEKLGFWREDRGNR
jgi:gentisate 1,2-dioxygenase